MNRSYAYVFSFFFFCVSCVSTQQATTGGPDPRAGLPPVETPMQKIAREAEEKKKAEARLVVLKEASPIINLRVVFQSGSRDDPAGKEGLSALTVRLMREATVDKDAAALADALFPMAAELFVQVDKDAIVFLGRAHKDHKDAFLKLFADVILRPRLDAGDFARLKEEATSHLTSTLRTGNDEALQREALEAMLYDTPAVLGAKIDGAIARHPYRHTPTGTVDGLASLTLDDVKAWRTKILTRDRMVIGVGGDVDDALIAQLKTELQELPASSAPRAAPATPIHKGGNKLLVVEKPSAGSAISLGFTLPQLSRSHPDYAAMKLAETWFGEHRNLIGHLFHSMREVRGLNYGDYAYVEHFVQDGWSTLEQLNIPRDSQYFSMWIRPVEHKNRLFALRMTAWELSKLVDAGIPDDEGFNKVKSFVAGYWKSKEQDPMRRLGYVVDQTLTGMPFDRDGLRERVQKLTRDDVNAAIKRHLRKDNLFFVVVTQDAAPMVNDIKSKAKSSITYNAKVDDSVLADDKQIEVFDLGLDADDVVVVPPTALFQK